MPKAKKAVTKEVEEKPKKVAKVAKEEKVAKAPKKSKAAKVAVDDVALIDPAAPPSEEKLEIISKFQVKEGDTGSPEVQVALLSKRIEKLVLHLKTNPSDNHSRRGLLGIVSKRRRLLNYLEKKDETRYKDIVDKLSIGK